MPWDVESSKGVAAMSQMSFADPAYAGKRKKTRREVILEEMEQVVPWTALLKVVDPFYPVAGPGRRPYPLQATPGGVRAVHPILGQGESVAQLGPQSILLPPLQLR